METDCVYIANSLLKIIQLFLSAFILIFIVLARKRVALWLNARLFELFTNKSTTSLYYI